LQAIVNQFDTITGTSLTTAAQWLLAGETVAIPTETVYGLAANALDPDAVIKIFEVKKRPSFDPLIVHIGHQSQVLKYTSAFPAALQRLINIFWPGPLTILAPKSDLIPDLVTSGLEQVAIRMPAHEIALELLQSLPFPLAAPSANPFGYISPTTAQHVMDQLGGQIPYILDGGDCSVGVESTIVGMENDQLQVYRLGGLSIEQIEAVAGPVSIRLNKSSNPLAPGMLKSHYAPRKPLMMGNIEEMLPHFERTAVGVLSLRPLQSVPAGVTPYYLSESGDLSEAARRLFAGLRALDQSNVSWILAEWMPDEGLGKAMNDRLRRAAYQKKK
jgi:L-threonylcarbamoyladenylate synthase